MHQIKSILLFLCTFLMIALLAGCGAKGDLYQVAEPIAAQKITAEEPQASDEKTQKKPQ